MNTSISVSFAFLKRSKSTSYVARPCLRLLATAEACFGAIQSNARRVTSSVLGGRVDETMPCWILPRHASKLDNVGILLISGRCHWLPLFLVKKGPIIILRGLAFVLFLILCCVKGCGGLPVLRLMPAATTRPPLGPLALVTCSTGPFGGPHLRFGLDGAVVFVGRWVAFFFAISAALLCRTARRAAMRNSCYLLRTLLRRSC